ncbi:class I SAM-dependent methyltransferase [Frigoribacterium faeni]|uniref:Methyltransferase n=1 Tax=Frigoribacterium faeni TaxID=145483 RepID=A0A7W3PHR8_9MICO|nr:class I SAM-dependent methyltransferase [Frigoribacterium faeni]MBA8812007.1 SAM-dependent methyltransferase [Frigoribacterium faeni]GEK83985.1 methyltransferase [Frigoribacterium faeni]
MTSEVRDAYAARAVEYGEHLGSMAAVHPSDRQLVDDWADGLDGEIVDAGCGPGHWTHHLTTRGLACRGVDQVSGFVDLARASYPGVRFEVGDLDALEAAPASVGGVLAWYSLIHHEPDAIQRPLAEFARVLRPGGGLLLGFFDGPMVEPFDHAVTRAHRWPIDRMAEEARVAGFEIVETRRRTGVGHRPHAAIVARRLEGG